jgi:hypothetical protein
LAIVEAAAGSQRGGKREAGEARMNTIIDPVDGIAMCGVCGSTAEEADWADECCVFAPDPPAWRSALALALVVASLVFLLALPVIYP